MEDAAMERYAKLGLEKALSRACDYAAACLELSFILRGAYSKLPKNLQLVVFQDTLSAFRLLPDVQTSSGTSSAHLLHQASEASLPKQKKAKATSEFKRSVVSQKRRSRVQEANEGSSHLPEDLLIRIFRYMDLKSLVTASSVCRLWKSASNDSKLWESMYSLYFGSYQNANESFESLDWKKAFKRKYAGGIFGHSASMRVFCAHCQSVIWASSICVNSAHECSRLSLQRCRLKPMTPDEIVTHLLGEPLLENSDCSGSDSEENLLKFSKLWAYPSLSGQ